LLATAGVSGHDKQEATRKSWIKQQAEDQIVAFMKTLSDGFAPEGK
jgi:hypothetical protein